MHLLTDYGYAIGLAAVLVYMLIPIAARLVELHRRHALRKHIITEPSVDEPAPAGLDMTAYRARQIAVGNVEESPGVFVGPHRVPSLRVSNSTAA